MLRVIQLTPPGRGAVATVLVEGPGAVAAVASGFRSASGRPLDAYGPDRPAFGTLELPGGEAEEVVVRVRSPRAVEVHCHGGRAALAAIQQRLVGRGASAVGWRTWLRGRWTDPIAREAQVALAEARTERTALILLDQYHGALGAAVERIIRLLRSAEGAAASAELQALLGRAAVGLHLTQPWHVVLAGPPNVGKSSLINALVGYQRAIVHGAPGTTRDVVTAITAIDGWPVELADTAGLRAGGGDIERLGVGLARQRIAEADLVVLVFDRSGPFAAAEQRLWEDLRAETTEASGQGELGPRSTPAPSRLLVVHNKADLPPAPGPPRPSGLAVSALTGQGVPSLLEAIAARLVPSPLPPGTAVPFTGEQIDALSRAGEAVRQGDLSAAIHWLERLSSGPSPRGTAG
ncbi:MAG TPA: GTP-binding protein [Planctomycetaceae bacterium]|nr:GTP-binding protein [Planctomycetaceae bacterium]